MTDFAEFGNPSRFAIAVRWAEDSEPRSRRPVAHGWSMGDLKITVAGSVLTQSTYPGRSQGHVGWYLSPLFGWLASNWTFLFHEEDFAWQERTGLPAAVACRKALHSWIDAEDASGRRTYREAQAWYARHGLRAAAEGGLFPDLFIRRLVDDVELSWTAAPPVFAPDGFTFAADPAHSCLPVEVVAEPLWKALRWFADTPPRCLDPSDWARWETIVREIDSLHGLSTEALQAPYIPARVAEIVAACSKPNLAQSRRSERAPVVTEFSPAVAMFGGVSPNLSPTDAQVLLGLLAASEGCDGAELERLVGERGLSPLGIPHRNGYDFAEDLLDDLDLPGASDWIDIDAILQHLGVAANTTNFDSVGIRGVALAGTNIAPKIVINESSIFNQSPVGRRFTLAHELCHILHDRSRARRVSHVSGPWVAQGFERRANAFAAYFLMPRALLVRHLDGRDAGMPETICLVAERLRVSESALVEHMFNLEFITDWEREELRPLFRQAKS